MTNELPTPDMIAHYIKLIPMRALDELADDLEDITFENPADPAMPDEDDDESQFNAWRDREDFASILAVITAMINREDDEDFIDRLTKLIATPREV